MKTAVEWLIDQMLKQGYFDCNEPLTFTNLDHLQQQAKEMEKEQIIDAVNNGWRQYDGKTYYNKTYEKKKD